MQRIVFSVIKSWRHRHILRQHVRQLPTCLDLKWETYRQYKVIILDFDGVLAGHGATELSPEVAAWLQQGVKQYKIYVLSNQPLQERVDYFQRHFPKITFFVGAVKKPYPDSIFTIMAQEHVVPAEVVLLDDRILTGILAAVLAGVTGVLITRPTVDWRAHLPKEVCFVLLRQLERFLLRAMAWF